MVVGWYWSCVRSTVDESLMVVGSWCWKGTTTCRWFSSGNPCKILHLFMCLPQGPIGSAFPAPAGLELRFTRVHQSCDLLFPWTVGLFSYFATVLPVCFQTVDRMLWHLWELQWTIETLFRILMLGVELQKAQSDLLNPGWRAQWRHQEIWEGVETSLDLRALDCWR